MSTLVDMIPKSVSLLFLGIGIAVGIAFTFFLIYRLGHSSFKRMDLQDRGSWDQPARFAISQGHGRGGL